MGTWMAHMIPHHTQPQSILHSTIPSCVRPSVCRHMCTMFKLHSHDTHLRYLKWKKDRSLSLSSIYKAVCPWSPWLSIIKKILFCDATRHEMWILNVSKNTHQETNPKQDDMLRGTCLSHPLCAFVGSCHLNHNHFSMLSVFQSKLTFLVFALWN